MSFFENMSVNKKILAEATERGTANDFWLVIDCKDSVDFKEYIQRTNAQGLINTITKLSKSKKTRDCLDTIAIFNKDDKSKAEKEAKRRAKHMKNTIENQEESDKVVTESEGDDCPKCKSKREKHERLASKAKRDANFLKTSTGPDAKKLSDGSAALSRYNSKLSKEKCDDCSGKTSDKKVDESIEGGLKGFLNSKSEEKVDEHYYADHASHNVLKPVNPLNVASDKETLGSSKTDNTVYGMKDKQSRIYSPSEQDAVDNEDERKVKVPAEVIKLLRDGAAEARNTSEKLIITKTEDKRFYNDLAIAFDDLREMLELGTIDGVKQAQIFLTSLMGPMLYRVPSEVATFIAHGGEPRSLRSYVNSITVPKIGYGVNGELDKL